MLYKDNLEEIIFQRHNLLLSDELIVLSGYVGPSPVSRLEELPIRSSVIYGMYGSDGIDPILHQSLTDLQGRIAKVNIFYSLLPVHSKAYVWRNRGDVVHALVGSANFSNNGLRTPYREILAETSIDTFRPLNEYVQHVLNNSQSCLEIANLVPLRRRPNLVVSAGDVCLMTLLDPRTGEVQNVSGLNWGQNLQNPKQKPNDASIPIRSEYIRAYPELFPPKQNYSKDPRGKAQRQNDAIEMIWDDEVTMEGLLEGNYPIGNVMFPKQISSFPHKSQLGEYFRNRLGVPSGQPVRRHHLEAYGRTDVGVSLIAEGVYRFDFSVNKLSNVIS